MSTAAVIIILYNPSKEDISNVVDIARYSKGIIVDNSIKPFTKDSVVGNMSYICNKKNLGIAEAQNIAIRTILDDGNFTHVIFLDQDSRISQSYIVSIVEEFNKVSQYIPRLAMIGPTIINVTTGTEDHSVVHNYSTDDNGFSGRQQIISSGSCCSVDILEKVGLMDSNLFIDYVDFEWCWRAISKGFVCGVTTNLSINHKVGCKDCYLGRYKVIISAPFRYFYQYRNYLWLLRRKYVPIRWKISMAIKMGMRFIYFPLFIKNGKECWQYMCRGIKEGILCCK